jgi:hypothetical protein
VKDSSGSLNHSIAEGSCYSMRLSGRVTKIEELIAMHDERMGELSHLIRRQDEHICIGEIALENTERLLVLEVDRVDRLERIEARQNELFAEISEQLRNLKG